MHIAAFIIPLIAGIISLFQGFIALTIGGATGNLADFLGDSEMGGIGYTASGMGLLMMVAAVTGIVGGIIAFQKKQAGWKVLAVATGISALAGFLVMQFAGFSDNFLYAGAYGISAFLGWKAANPDGESKPAKRSADHTSVEPAEMTPGQRFCTQCGSEIKTGFQFCPNCGSKVDSNILGQEIPSGTTPSNEQTVEKPRINDSEKTAQETVENKPTEVQERESKKKNQSKRLYVLLAVGVMIIVFGAFAVFASAPTNQEEFIQVCSTGSLKDVKIAIIASTFIPDVDINGRDLSGWTALLGAAGNSNPEVISALIRAGADVNARSDEGMTALMRAALLNPNPEVISALIRAGADVNAQHWETGLTVLMGAAFHNPNPEVISALIRAGADVNARWEETGSTALMFAAQMNPNPEVISALIRAGADINARADDGTTALRLAIEWNPNPSVATVLKEAGAKR